MPLIEGISTEAAATAARALVDEAVATLLPKILEGLKPVLDVAQQAQQTLTRIDTVLDRLTGAGK